MNNPYWKLTYTLTNGEEEESNRVVHLIDVIKQLIDNDITSISIEKLTDEEFEETEK